MCGIIGIVGKEQVADRLVDGLRRMEYRGYDSAGICLVADGQLVRRRAEGKLNNLVLELVRHPAEGLIGIAHTRWATHGAPTEANAHPHASAKVAIVHNGIIENFRELKAELQAKGHVFTSETDSETAAHLVTQLLSEGLAPDEAAKQAVARLTGAYSIAMIFKDHEGLRVGARRGAPLAVGYADTEAYIGSDAFALAPFTNRVAYLEEGDVVVIRGPQVSIFDAAGRPANREIKITSASAALVDKAGHAHFMAKEIHEQPEVVGRTLAHYLDMSEGAVRLPFDLPFAAKDLTSITISACGTAYYAGLVAKYWFERYARLPVEIDVASEFRYREAPLKKGGLMILISQSGETADTLASLRYAKENGLFVLSVVNVATSTIARESHVVAPTLAGPEIGVASTKAFTCQLSVLACLALAFGRATGALSSEREAQLVSSLIAVPGLMAEALKREPLTEQLAHQLSRARDVLYLGRGTSFPLALEGALKLKEISYIHAEGYAAGELKHGPIALIDEDMPVIVIAPFDPVFEKTVSNMQEVAARGGRIILIADQRAEHESSIDFQAVIAMAEMEPDFAPIVYAVPVQQIAYYTAVHMGKDVDQPRNLAKSVTVE